MSSESQSIVTQGYESYTPGTSSIPPDLSSRALKLQNEMVENAHLIKTDADFGAKYAGYVQQLMRELHSHGLGEAYQLAMSLQAILQNTTGMVQDIMGAYAIGDFMQYAHENAATNTWAHQRLLKNGERPLTIPQNPSRLGSIFGFLE